MEERDVELAVQSLYAEHKGPAGVAHGLCSLPGPLWSRPQRSEALWPLAMEDTYSGP